MKKAAMQIRVIGTGRDRKEKDLRRGARDL